MAFPAKKWIEAAKDIHCRYPVVDAHCDTLLHLARGGRLDGPEDQTGQVSLQGLKAAGVRLVFFSVFAERATPPGARLRRAIQLIDRFWLEYLANRDCLVLVERRKDLEKPGIGVLLTLEGGEALEEDLAVLRQLYRLGVRGVGLTWNYRNALAGGIMETRAPGLSDFGVRVVEEMNRLGMIVDAAHLNPQAFEELLEVSRAPVVVTHANAHRLCPHPRNLTDDQLKALAARGGVVGVTFVPDFVDLYAPSVERVADHIEYLCSIMGIDAVGLGSDFDGTDGRLPGLENVASLPNLTASLLARGFDEPSVAKILGGNWLRLLERVLE
jgi:membrane dipeptidase